MMKIYFENGCLETMLVSASEVYPLETVGLVFGTLVRDEFNCAVCYPVQTASRKLEHVSCEQKFIDRVTRSVQAAHGYKLLGCYHSHPNGSTDPSEGDIVTYKRLNLPLLIIVSVKATKRRTTSFAIGSGSIDLEVIGHLFGIKPYHGEGWTSVFDKIVSPFVEVNKILQAHFGISTFELATLIGEDRDRVKYSVEKLAYNVKRQEIPGKEEYSKQNTAYHIERIRKILSNYKFD